MLRISFDAPEMLRLSALQQTHEVPAAKRSGSAAQYHYQETSRSTIKKGRKVRFDKSPLPCYTRPSLS